MKHRLVIIFAHPDDESFGFAGTLSAMTDAGHEATYIVGTRGEVGEILVDGLVTRETLGEVREGELRIALEMMGVSDLRLLGYRDSGMAGSEENNDPRAFINQDVNLVADRIAEILLERQPTIVLTYGIDGIYGHPDHVMAHKSALAGVLKAGERGWQTPNLYFASASRERIKRMSEIPTSPFASMPKDQLSSFGTPSSEITTWLDIREFSARKLAAIKAHRSQVGDDGPFAHATEEERNMWLSIETARMIPLPWNPEPIDVLLDILPQAPDDHPLRG